MMRESKDFVVNRVGRLLASHREVGTPPTYNDFTLATYLYSHGVGFIEGRPCAAGAQALRGAAAIFTAHPDAVMGPLLTGLAVSASERGDDEQAHALTDALDLWTMERPNVDPATWLISRSVYVETGGDGD